MEAAITWKRLPKYVILLIYCCGVSLFFICAFYAYSVNETNLYKTSNYLAYTGSEKELVKTLASDNTKRVNTRDVPFEIHRETNTSIGADDKFISDEEDKIVLEVSPSAESKKTGMDKDNNGQSITHKQGPQSSNGSLLLTTTLVPLDTSCSSTVVKPKLILLWTPFFGYWEYMRNETFLRCPSCSNCRVTQNRSRLRESDAVVFHARDMNVADLPAERPINQRWIFYCLESPEYSDFPGLQFTHNMFNWSMTYRSDSDIVTRYGAIEKRSPKKKLDLIEMKSIWESKSRTVVWMASHCPTAGGREHYVAELKKYLDVDVHGSCGQHTCPKTVDCLRRFEKKYKFYLAFENSICEDYVTEKLYKTFQYDMVPVVFGGAKYQKLAPPGSYINALEFKSPKHLAYFLVGVGNDFSLYSKYFAWRRDYEVKTDLNKECAVCSKLHNDNDKSSVYEYVRLWWIKGGRCHTWTKN